MLNTSQENIHTTNSHLIKEERLLEGLSLKTPIAWGKANDERWAQLDDVVSSELKNCNSLTERLDLLQTQYIMSQPTYLTTLNHVKEILPDRARGLNCPSSSLKKRTC